MVINVRRVGTGHNKQGQSIFVINDIAASEAPRTLGACVAMSPASLLGA